MPKDMDAGFEMKPPDELLQKVAQARGMSGEDGFLSGLEDHPEIPEGRPTGIFNSAPPMERSAGPIGTLPIPGLDKGHGLEQRLPHRGLAERDSNPLLTDNVESDAVFQGKEDDELTKELIAGQQMVIGGTAYSAPSHSQADPDLDGLITDADLEREAAKPLLVGPSAPATKTKKFVPEDQVASVDRDEKSSLFHDVEDHNSKMKAIMDPKGGPVHKESSVIFTRSQVQAMVMKAAEEGARKAVAAGSTRMRHPYEGPDSWKCQGCGKVGPTSFCDECKDILVKARDAEKERVSKLPPDPATEERIRKFKAMMPEAAQKQAVSPEFAEYAEKSHGTKHVCPACDKPTKKDGPCSPDCEAMLEAEADSVPLESAAAQEVLTPEEMKAFKSAFWKTWGYVGQDAAELGVRENDVNGVAEMVLDAGRILQIGKLDPAIWAKLEPLGWKGMLGVVRKMWKMAAKHAAKPSSQGFSGPVKDVLKKLNGEVAEAVKSRRGFTLVDLNEPHEFHWLEAADSPSEQEGWHFLQGTEPVFVGEDSEVVEYVRDNILSQYSNLAGLYDEPVEKLVQDVRREMRVIVAAVGSTGVLDYKALRLKLKPFHLKWYGNPQGFGGVNVVLKGENEVSRGDEDAEFNAIVIPFIKKIGPDRAWELRNVALQKDENDIVIMVDYVYPYLASGSNVIQKAAAKPLLVGPNAPASKTKKLDTEEAIAQNDKEKGEVFFDVEHFNKQMKEIISGDGTIHIAKKYPSLQVFAGRFAELSSRIDELEAEGRKHMEMIPILADEFEVHPNDVLELFDTLYGPKNAEASIVLGSKTADFLITVEEYLESGMTPEKAAAALSKEFNIPESTLLSVILKLGKNIIEGAITFKTKEPIQVEPGVQMPSGSEVKPATTTPDADPQLTVVWKGKNYKLPKEVLEGEINPVVPPSIMTEMNTFSAFTAVQQARLRELELKALNEGVTQEEMAEVQRLTKGAAMPGLPVGESQSGAPHAHEGTPQPTELPPRPSPRKVNVEDGDPEDPDVAAESIINRDNQFPIPESEKGKGKKGTPKMVESDISALTPAFYDVVHEALSEKHFMEDFLVANTQVQSRMLADWLKGRGLHLPLSTVDTLKEELLSKKDVGALEKEKEDFQIWAARQVIEMTVPDIIDYAISKGVLDNMREVDSPGLQHSLLRQFLRDAGITVEPAELKEVFGELQNQVNSVTAASGTPDFMQPQPSKNKPVMDRPAPVQEAKPSEPAKAVQPAPKKPVNPAAAVPAVKVNDEHEVSNTVSSAIDLEMKRVLGDVFSASTQGEMVKEVPAGKPKLVKKMKDGEPAGLDAPNISQREDEFSFNNSKTQDYKSAYDSKGASLVSSLLHMGGTGSQLIPSSQPNIEQTKQTLAHLKEAEKPVHERMIEYLLEKGIQDIGTDETPTRLRKALIEGGFPESEIEAFITEIHPVEPTPVADEILEEVMPQRPQTTRDVKMLDKVDLSKRRDALLDRFLAEKDPVKKDQIKEQLRSLSRLMKKSIDVQDIEQMRVRPPRTSMPGSGEDVTWKSKDDQPQEPAIGPVGSIDNLATPKAAGTEKKQLDMSQIGDTNVREGAGTVTKEPKTYEGRVLNIHALKLFGKTVDKLTFQELHQLWKHLGPAAKQHEVAMSTLIRRKVAVQTGACTCEGEAICNHCISLMVAPTGGKPDAAAKVVVEHKKQALEEIIDLSGDLGADFPVDEDGPFDHAASRLSAGDIGGYMRWVSRNRPELDKYLKARKITRVPAMTAAGRVFEYKVVVGHKIATQVVAEHKTAGIRDKVETLIEEVSSYAEAGAGEAQIGEYTVSLSYNSEEIDSKDRMAAYLTITKGGQPGSGGQVGSVPSGQVELEETFEGQEGWDAACEALRVFFDEHVKTAAKVDQAFDEAMRQLNAIPGIASADALSEILYRVEKKYGLSPTEQKTLEDSLDSATGLLDWGKTAGRDFMPPDQDKPALLHPESGGMESGLPPESEFDFAPEGQEVHPADEFGKCDHCDEDAIVMENLPEFEPGSDKYYKKERLCSKHYREKNKLPPKDAASTEWDPSRIPVALANEYKGDPLLLMSNDGKTVRATIEEVVVEGAVVRQLIIKVDPQDSARMKVPESAAILINQKHQTLKDVGVVAFIKASSMQKEARYYSMSEINKFPIYTVEYVKRFPPTLAKSKMKERNGVPGPLTREDFEGQVEYASSHFSGVPGPDVPEPKPQLLDVRHLIQNLKMAF